jgi:hypothetical protein
MLRLGVLLRLTVGLWLGAGLQLEGPGSALCSGIALPFARPRFWGTSPCFSAFALASAARKFSSFLFASSRSRALSLSHSAWAPGSPVSSAIPWEIKDEDARVAAGGSLEHLGVAERMHRIAITGEPTPLNGPAGEFVIF